MQNSPVLRDGLATCCCQGSLAVTVARAKRFEFTFPQAGFCQSFRAERFDLSKSQRNRAKGSIANRTGHFSNDLWTVGFNAEDAVGAEGRGGNRNGRLEL